MKKREKIDDLLKLVEGLPLHPYKAPRAVQKIEDLVNLIEGLPLHRYEAPGAVQDVARKMAKNAGKDEPHELLGGKTIAEWAADFVRLNILCDLRHYNYGYGILLRKHDRDRLIKASA